MALVHMATCSIHWAILWSTESIKIRHFARRRILEDLGSKPGEGFWRIWGQNQEKDFGGFGVKTRRRILEDLR